MKTRTQFSIAWLVTLAAIALLLGPSPALAIGGLEFLNSSLPSGRPGNLYVARLLAANADGSTTFRVAAGSADPLPAGLTLDPQTGSIVGIPGAGNSDVTFEAVDDTSVAQFVATIDIGNSGSGGGAGPTLGNTSFADGRVGTSYAATLTATGVGPFTFGVSGLPTGLRLNGQTGDITGTPVEAGMFALNLSITDAGDADNKGFTRIPIVIRPSASEFRFATVLLDNGEIGTPYLDAIGVLGETNAGVVFAASSLPAGLTMDAATGNISGTPLEAGTFLVGLSASSGGETISARLPVWIVATNTSQFFWNFFGLPIATTGVLFDGLPGVFLDSQNGTNVGYSVRGLPTGISYDAVTGELTGTTTETGFFPVVFTATDSATGEVLSLTTNFPVLRAGGGNANGLTTSLWVTNQSYKTARNAWQGKYNYNSDRRTGAAFDPNTESLDMMLGSREISLAPGDLVESRSGTFAFKRGKGVVPVVSVKLDPRKETIQVTTRKDTLVDTLPGNLENVIFMGNRGYKLTEFFDAAGKFGRALGLRNASFVALSAKALVKGGGVDTLNLKLVLADPAFAYTAGVSTLRFRLLSQGIVLVDRDFTALGVSAESTDKATGTLLFALKKLRDASPIDTVSKFTYKTKTGAMALSLKNAALSALPAGQAHITLEVTIGTEIYSTNVTLVEGRPGNYSSFLR